ncbi:murein biosynthesis integral membrane protein MurJ [Maliponia aquimaris]|uniref:Probable lipid II flippase MurJ n=1 Tax=Maliponia aquimaris TaxID=1673631 RepID=A0A238JZ33_9RHOB|nr:murein biosynthesis integral membrane protein MurJ [Maliponia aquimaris]SMX35910.1 putative peptidoglycan biosynthesis protein MurJ [Maliponia aquimaris]
MPRLAAWHRAFATVAGLTLVSRVLGFGRDLILAAVLGTGPVAVAFMLAFRLSNQLRALVAEGAFTAAFQPIDARLPPDSAEAQRFRAETLGWLLLGNLVLLVVVLAVPGAVLRLLAPGFGPDDPVHLLARDLLRLTFPFLLCISLVAYFGARLGSQGRFWAFAAAPSVMNLVLIAGLLLAGLSDWPGHVAALAVLVSGVAQVALVGWAMQRAGLAQPWPRLGLSGHTRRFFRNLGPAVLSAGATQVAVFIDTVLASFLPGGALAHLYFADRLYQLPIGLISVALGTVLLPEIARRSAEGGDGRAPLRQALAVCAGIGVPIALVMGLWGAEIIALLFQRGSFTSEDTAATAQILAGYALGVVPALFVRPLVVQFQGLGDTATPFRLLLAALVVNLGCKLALVPALGAVGLALGTSAGTLAYVLLLGWTLRRQG